MGVVSVIPYACMNGILWIDSKARIILLGAADPPHKIARTLLVSYEPCFNSCNKPNQIVGTPALIVTSYFSIISAIIVGVIKGPGNTCVVANIIATNGIPHAFTWNIGTTGMSRSDSEIAAVSAILSAIL